MLDDTGGDSPKQASPATTEGFAEWLTSSCAKPPAGSVKVTLTPDRALACLERNTANRPLTKSRYTKFAREIMAGNWEYTGEPVIFSKTGVLIDGQHRCWGVVEAGKSIQVDFKFGVADKAFAKIDIGHKRTNSDIFAIKGEENYSALASAARIVWRYENTGMMQQPGFEPEAAELWEYMNERHAGLREFARKTSFFQDTGWGAPTMFVALNYLCSLKSARAAEEFYWQLATGNDIGTRDKNHPINRLRSMFQTDIKERLLGRGTSPLVKAAYTVKGWNAWRAGKTMGVYRWRGESNPNEAFPRIK